MKRGISIKILFPMTILISIIIPVLITNTVFYEFSLDTYEDQHKSEIQYRAQSIDISLNEYLNGYKTTLNVISDYTVWEDFHTYNETLTQQDVKDLYGDLSLIPNTVYADEFQSIKDLITNFEQDETIKTMYIGTPQKNLFGNDAGDNATFVHGIDSDFDLTEREWYIGALANPDSVYFSIPYVDRQNEDNVITILSASKAIYTDAGELIGVLSMDILLDEFSNKIVDFTLDDEYESYIINDEGRFVFHHDINQIDNLTQNSDLIEYLESSDEYLAINGSVYTKLENSSTGWYIIQSYSSNHIQSDIDSIIQRTLPYLILMLGLVIVFTLFVTWYYLKPIRLLTTHFKKVNEHQEFDVELDQKMLDKKNEIGQLYHSIKNMQETIDLSIKDIEYLSYNDELTKTYNRRYFEEELKRYDNARNLPLSVMMVDVNGLKLINDAFGHTAGDALLQETAHILMDITRGNDIVARWGGDEFVILLPDTPETGVKVLTKRILDRTDKIDFKYGKISLAIGASTKTDKEQDFKEVFALAEEIMYQEKHKDISSVRSQTIQTILATLFEKSRETKLHTERVAEFSEKLAYALELPVNKVNDIKLMATIHDIGKIIIDSSVLEKPGSLTKEERDIINYHPTSGSKMLSRTNEYSRLAPGVLHHHERIDGKGYPNGLKGEQIPLESKIIAVCDAFDAMTTERPYKNKLSIEEAIEELKANSGTQFEPEIVEVFISKVLMPNNK